MQATKLQDKPKRNKRQSMQWLSQLQRPLPRLVFNNKNVSINWFTEIDETADCPSSILKS